MTDRDLLEQELMSLGGELRSPPSIAPAVFQALELDLSSPASWSGVLHQGTDKWDKTNGRERIVGDRLRPFFFGSLAAATVVFVCAILAVTVLNSDKVAFAQVQQRLAAVRTATFTLKQSVVKRLQDGQATSVDIRRVSVRNDGRVRIEGSDGDVMIISEDDFIQLETDPKQHSATLRYLYEIEDQKDIVTYLRTLHKSREAIAIPPKEIKGVEYPGFRIEERESTLLVWIDRKTHLPAYAERSYSKALSVPEGDVLQVDEKYDDMKFDVPIANEMFSVVPPAGYTVTTIGTPPADRKEIFAEPLVLTPNVGAGPLKFRMPRAEIVRLLGKPDEERIHVPNITVTEDTGAINGIQRPEGASLVVQTEIHIMSYHGLGMRLTVEATDGLRAIQCFGQDSLGPQGRTFRGATEAKIGIGSPREDILKAYGKPEKISDKELDYDRLNLKFYLTEQQTVRSIVLEYSYDRQIRFEWRVPTK